MTRVALYARYSSDRQNALSIADQIAVCMRHAQAQGWTLGPVYSDAAISGAAMANRPGLLQALEAAGRDFEVLLCEDEDRIARNLEHLAHVANRLKASGAYLSTLSTPRVETMHVAFKGLIAEDYLRALSAKTSRGMRANSERGLSGTGSRLYGYRTQPGGAIEIVPAEADVVRRIYGRYVAGATPRAIASELNAEGVPSSRGGPWNASSINGSRQRGNGVLWTELYAGRMVWNRVEVSKDPFTGRRIDRVRPREEWRRTDVPQLRIVDEDVWLAAQARKAREGECAAHELNRARHRHVFSGLLKCGVCGGSYVSSHKGRLGCATLAERGPTACSNRRTVLRAEVERRVLSGLRERLLAPELVAAYVRAYHQAWTEKQAQLVDRREPIEKRLADIRRSEQRTIDAIERGTATAAMEARMMERDQERVRLECELAEMEEPEPPITLHPHAAQGYAERIGRLQEILARAAEHPSEARLDLMQEARGLVDRIVITPISQEPRAEVTIELFGHLAKFVTDADPVGDPRVGRMLVVGGGIEPPT